MWVEVTAKSIEGCWRKGLGPAFEVESDVAVESAASESDESFDGFEPIDVDVAERRKMACGEDFLELVFLDHFWERFRRQLLAGVGICG